MKYRAQISAFVTRMSTRGYVVSAESEEEAARKAYERMVKTCMADPRVCEVGDPCTDSVQMIEQ